MLLRLVSSLVTVVRQAGTQADENGDLFSSFLKATFQAALVTFGEIRTV